MFLDAFAAFPIGARDEPPVLGLIVLVALPPHDQHTDVVVGFPTELAAEECLRGAYKMIGQAVHVESGKGFSRSIPEA